MIVLDASAALPYLLDDPPAHTIRERFGVAGETLHAPHLLDLEVCGAVRRLALAQSLSRQRAEATILDLAALPITRYPHDWLLHRIWDLRANLTVYDAAYVALAEALQAPVLTLDRRLAAAPGIATDVELIASAR